MKALRLWLIFLFIIPALSAFQAKPAHGQDNNTYFIANGLFQQQKFEEAYPLFKKLHENEPDNYLFLERATQCLINLKQYDKAIALTEEGLQKSPYKFQGKIRLGEIYHIKGETEKAFEIWDEILSSDQQSLQIYIDLASAMRNRRKFEQAITVYNKAENRFPSSALLIIEKADTYMQAGTYDEAIRLYLSLIKSEPNRIDYVQSKIFRLRDDRLYDAAILEIDDFLDELPDKHLSKNILQQLELWLLLERGLAERALATAKRFENNTDRPSYLLYSLGSRLLAAEEFDLAEQAYTYLFDAENQSLRQQSMEQLATVYIRWGDFLANYSLAFSSKRDLLYQQAYNTLQMLANQAPNYQYMSRVLVTQAELSLNYLHNPDQAAIFVQKLQTLNDSSYTAQHAYLQGRIKLYRGDFGRARIDFSKSNNRERIGNLAEKTRYYLALTDFYSGDYEFANIQLNALERQKTSYFANDAVKLRVWIQQGLSSDSTGTSIKPFADAVRYYEQGNIEKGYRTLAVMIDSNTSHPLRDEALLEMSTHPTASSLESLFIRLNKFTENGNNNSPFYERLLWESARIADQALTQPAVKNSLAEKSVLPSTSQELISLYEALLLSYPQGFYTSYARNRIQELQQNPL